MIIADGLVALPGEPDFRKATIRVSGERVTEIAQRQQILKFAGPGWRLDGELRRTFPAHRAEPPSLEPSLEREREREKEK